MENISRRQFIFVGTAATFAALGLAGCGGSGSGSGDSAEVELKDGTFQGKSGVKEDGINGDGYGEITITVENGVIVDASFKAFLPDGTPKDENYGKDGPSYGVAQMVIGYADDYAAELVEYGNLDDVDAESGATYLYEQFVEATEDALSKAK